MDQLGGEDHIQDTGLPFLTVTQADRLRYLVQQEFAARGREVTVYSDHLRDGRKSSFGLWNVAAACRADTRGESAWPVIVAEHVRNLLAAVNDAHQFVELTPEEAQSRTYIKLLPVDSLSAAYGPSYLGETVPGLVSALVLDSSNAVRSLSEHEVEQYGGWATLRDAGLANLRAIQIQQRKPISTPDGAGFDMLLGESVYTASRVLMMDDVLKSTLESVNDVRYGVLAIMATNHQIGIHVIRGRSVVPSLRLMAHFAKAGFSDGAGTLSPNVFWWQDGRWTQLTRQGAGDTIEVIPCPALVSMIQEFKEL